MTLDRPFPDQRYVIVSDDSAHRYYIPAEKVEEWDAFMEHPEMPYLDTPDWACRIDGIFTFTDPRCSF